MELNKENMKKEAKSQITGLAKKKAKLAIISSLPQIAYFGFLGYIGVIVIIGVIYLFLILSSLFGGVKTTPSTGLTYFDSEVYYGLPYRAGFENGNYGSVFDKVSSLSKNKKEITKKKFDVNNKLKQIFEKTTFKDVLGKDKCRSFCSNKISDIYSTDLIISSSFRDPDTDTFYTKIVNAKTNKLADFISLHFYSKKDDKNYNLYYYELLGNNLENSRIITKGRNGEINKGIKILYLKPKKYVNYYDFDSNDDYDEKESNKLISTDAYHKYFLSKHNLIDKIYKSSGYSDDEDKLKVIIDSFNAILNNNLEIKKEISDIIKETIQYEEDSINQGAITDMLNFSGIKSAQNQATSLSNQFLLSKEKINLDYFNQIPFGKDYKNLIVNTKDFKGLNLEQAQKILKFKADSTDEDSNEFGFVVKKTLEKEIPIGKYGIKGEDKVVEKKNEKPILKSGEYFYSPSITYKSITNGKSENCKIIYPHKQNGDYVPYIKEALYTGQKVKIACPYKVKGKTKYKRYTYQVPPLIQEAEIIYYKKFKFKDNIDNKKSKRNLKDYYLNYFYDKEFINLKDDTKGSTISKVSDIYLDRTSIQFKGIYLKVKGFGIELKDDGSFVAKKKGIDSYSAILPDAPIKFEIGILTDLNTDEIESIRHFEQNYNFLNKKDKIGEKKFYYYKVKNYTDKVNPFFIDYRYSLYKGNEANNEGKIIELVDNLDLKSNDLTKGELGLLKKIADKELIKLKNSYFYTLPQRKKLMSILSDIYYGKDNNEFSRINAFKKYLVFLGDFSTNGNSRVLLAKHIGDGDLKNTFNFNYSGGHYGKKIKYTRPLDQCYSYNILNEVYRKGLNTILGTTENNDSNTIIARDLVKSCYGSYLPYINVKIELNPNKKFSIIEEKELKEQIIKDFGYNIIHTYINNPKLYKYLNNDNYITNIDKESKETEIYKLYEDPDKTIEENNIIVLSKINKFLLSADNLENLFNEYKNTKEYKESCDEEKESLLKDAKDTNFKCNLNDIYDEFLTKITKNKKDYYFIKEEYLKESIQDEPFYTYYDSLTDLEAKNIDFFANDTNIELSSGKYVPLPIDDVRYTFRGFKYGPAERNRKNFFKRNDWYMVSINNSRIYDYSYFFNLEKTFSFSDDNYIDEIKLHKIPLNPNLYLHSFFTKTKKSAKYNIQISGKGFEGVESDKNKLELDKEYITDISNFILNKITNRKVIDDLKDITILDDQWIISFNILPMISDYSAFLSDVTVGNNLDNYIDNVKIGKKISSITQKSFNNSNISNFDILLKKYNYEANDDLMTKKEKEDVINSQMRTQLLYGGPYGAILHSALSEDFTDGRANLMNKYWYSVYVLNLLEEHYKEKGINFNNTLLGNISNYDDIVNTLNKKSDDDKVALLYKDILLYLWGYMDKNDFSTLPGGDYLGIIGVNPNFDGFGVDTIQDVLLEEPTDIKELSSIYQLYEDNSDELTKEEKENIKKAISKLDNKDYLKDIGKLTSKIIIDGKGEEDKLIGIDIKKEKVLNLELYYSDFYDYIKKMNEEFTEVTDETINTGSGGNNDNKTKKLKDEYIDITEIEAVIRRQLEVLKIMKRNYPIKYYNYYLAPIINNEVLTEKQYVELKDFYSLVIEKDYNILTSLKEYNSYINIIKNGLPTDISDKYSTIPFNKFNGNYSYKPSVNGQNSNGMFDIRRRFIKDNDTTMLPLYNMLGDLFLYNGRQKSTIENKIITTKANKLDTEINLNQLQIISNNKKIKLLKAGGDLSKKIQILKDKIKRIEQYLEKNDTIKGVLIGGKLLVNMEYKKALKNYKKELVILKEKEKRKGIKELEEDNKFLQKEIERIKKEIETLTEEEKEELIEYRVFTNGTSISIEKIKDKKEEVEEYKKATFFTGPFSPKKDIGFYINQYGREEDETFTKNLINSYIGFSFILNNLKVTEDGIKGIADELGNYAENVSNTKIDKFENFEDLGLFSPYYINNGYIDPLSENHIKFNLLGVEYGEGGQQSGFDTEFSIVGLRDRLTNEVLRRKFEDLKDTYCKKMPSDKKQSQCINYMSYLQTLNPSTLEAEMEYITMLLYVKKTPLKKYVFYHGNQGEIPIWYRYNNLAAHMPKNSVIRDYFNDMFVKNKQYLGQCTWYAAFLKTKKNKISNWSGHGISVASNIGAQGFPTDRYDPRKEDVKTLLKKIQVGDIISFRGRNIGRKSDKNNSTRCKKGSALGFGHVAVVIDTDKKKGTVTLGEMNVAGTFSVRKRIYNVKKICDGTVVHGLERRY